MNPLTPYLLWIKIGAGAALLAGLADWHMHAVHAARADGAAEVTAQRNAIDAKNTARAQAELLAANDRLHAAQSQLAAAQLDLQKLQQENDHEKAISSQRAADLAAGRQRERVLVRAASPACNPAQAGSVAGAAAAAVDQGASAEVDLDPGVAAALEGVRAQHNDAVARLGACIAAYDAVKVAADAP